MDIIISANEKILEMTQSLKKNMSEEEYMRWLEEMIGLGEHDEQELQEVPI